MNKRYFIVGISCIVYLTLIGHGFGARTIVHKVGGSCIDIKRLCRSSHRKKSRIVTYDPYYGMGQHKIKRSGHSKTERFICFGFEDNSCDIVCTPLQEFFLFSTQQCGRDCPSSRNGGWVPAYKLKKGDLLFCKDGPKPIKHINYVKKTIDVYIVELSGVHTFFVGYYGALTHNMDLPMVWGIGASTSCGAGAGSSAGSFFGPFSSFVGVALGAFIGLCIGLIQNNSTRKYSCNNVPLHFFDEYEQNNASSSVSSSVGGGSLSPMPDGPKKDDKNKNSKRTNKELYREVKNLSKQLKKHKKKLANYIKNPDKYDNKNFLKRAVNLEQRNSVIQGRIKHLKVEIKNFQRLIDSVNKEFMLRGVL